MPQRFQGQRAVEQRQAVAEAALATWWTGFDDPQLTRFVTLALAQNLDLAQAAARVTQARAGRAANAALLPSGNVSGQAARVYQSVETPLGRVLNSTPGFDRHGNDYEADFTASWELDVFGGLRRGRSRARRLSGLRGGCGRDAPCRGRADGGHLHHDSRVAGPAEGRAASGADRTGSVVDHQSAVWKAAELQVRQAEGALAQVRKRCRYSKRRWTRR